LDADSIFKNAIDGFEIRRQSNHNEIKLVCMHCNQKIIVSSSKYDKLHFKHEPDSEYCILKDDTISAKEINEFNECLAAKESPRHKELKNKIGSLIKVTEGFNIETLAVDDKFIFIANNKRKPDVYCEYQGKKIVFEIQLSKLSQRYLLDRYDFYTKNGFYLIWMLDNFNVQDQSTFERDIKYLTEYQNFFSLDETSSDLRLICNYKFPYIFKERSIQSKWMRRSVKFLDLKFDSNIFQIYFYDYQLALNLVDVELVKIKERKKEKEIEEAENAATGKAHKIIKQIIKCRVNNFAFNSSTELIEELDFFELSILNDVLQFKSNKKLAVHTYLNSASAKDIGFISFLLTCYKIEFNTAELDVEGKSLLITLYNNPAFNDHLKYNFALHLIYRGYSFQQTDFEFLNAYFKNPIERNEKIRLYQIYNKLYPKTLVHQAHQIKHILFVIESAYEDNILGSRLRDWIAFANNAIQHYSAHWEYIELAFKKSGLFDKLISLDKKHTFQKKLDHLYNNFPIQDYSCDKVFRSLYPELFF
jgi:competence CoiA-like predicted nuclease